jgi:hypothetical protein
MKPEDAVHHSRGQISTGEKLSLLGGGLLSLLWLGTLVVGAARLVGTP